MYIAGMNGTASSDSALVKATRNASTTNNTTIKDNKNQHIKNGMPSQYINIKNDLNNINNNNKVLNSKSKSSTIGARVVTLTLDL